MSTLKRHIGRIKNTDRRCVVIFNQIPGNKDNALIVDTDSLPDRFHDNLMDIVDSNEGQQAPELYTILSRRIVSDLGIDLMNALHSYGFLRSVPVDQIIMYPTPHNPIPLRYIIDVNTTTEEKGALETPRTEVEPQQNRFLENQNITTNESQLAIARNILMQANDLEAEAIKKRNEAYKMAPSLRPTTVETAPAVTTPVTAPVTAPQPTLDCPESPVENQVTSQGSEELEFVSDLPEDVAKAYSEALLDAQNTEQLTESVGNSSVENIEPVTDDKVQSFLDRVAYREDQADRELQESLKPKAPVGRPRKDGLPAGTKPIVPPSPPKKRGRPPKASK